MFGFMKQYNHIAEDRFISVVMRMILALPDFVG